MKAGRKSKIEGGHKKHKAIRRRVGPAKRKAADSQTRADAQGKIAGRNGIQRDITERKQAEEVLRETQERLTLAIRSANVGLWDWDLRTNIVYYSPEWKSQLGYKDHEISNDFSEWERRVHPDDLASAKATVSAYLERSYPNYHREFRMRHKDGSYRWILAQASLLADEQGKPIRMLGSHIDITERKQAEAQLQLSEERLKYALAGANDGLWDWNVQTGAAYFSPRWKAMLRYAEDELPDTYESWDSRLHPDDKPRVLKALQAHFNDAGRDYEPEFRMLTKAGEWIWIQARGRVVERDHEGHPMRMVGTHTDITARKQAEEALRESESKYRLLFENMQEGFSLHKMILDENGKAVDFRFLDTNEAYEHHTGFKRRDVIGRTIREILPQVDPRQIENYGKVALTGEPHIIEYYSKAFGRHFRVRAFSFERGCFATIFEDITERKLAESKLRESEAYYRMLTESLTDFVVHMDREGKILYINRLAEGYTLERVRGSSTYDYIPPEYHETMRQVLNQVFQEGQPAGFETQGQISATTLGWYLTRLVPVKENEEVVGALLISTDITARKQAEEKIRRQNQRLKVLREIDTAILAADSVENIVGAALSHIRELIDCRRAALSLFNWGTNEAVFFDVKTVNETSIPKGMHVPLALFQDMIQTFSKNEPVVINDLNTLADPPPQIQSIIRDGLRSLCNLPLFSQGNLIGAFSLSSEISGFFDEEKIDLGREVANQVAIAITQNNLLEALRDLNAELEGRVVERTAQLQAANKELEAFSYSVSHDLRAPLRAIDGFSQALTRKYAGQLGQEGEHYLRRIQENTRRMGQLIDDLLSLGRITRREMQQDEVDLAKLAHEIAAELQAQTPERRVQFEIEEQTGARGDVGLLRIVLQNLLGNAWKFSSTQPQARIQFGSIPHPRPLSQGEGTVFFVHDNGVGFDMAYADKLFGAFQRLHAMDEFPGSGIGLATVQRIIHRHGGRIWVEAALDQGATFYFTLGGKP